MTQAPVRPRAVPGSDPTGSGVTGTGLEGAAVTPRPRHAHLGMVHVLQLVAVELGLLGVLVALRGGALAVTGAAVGALLLTGVALTRRQGRWLTEWLLLRARARQRRRFTPDPGEPDARVSALRCLAPRLAVEDVEGHDGTRIGVGYDGEGWFAALAVAPGAGLNGDSSPGVPLSALAAILDPHPQTGLDDPGQAGAAVQVVTLTTPAPDAALAGGSPAERSYRDLLTATGPAPAARTTWVSIRLEARVLAAVGAGDRDESVRVPPALPRMVRRAVKTLQASGLPLQVLDADGLLDALAVCCDLSPAVDSVATPFGAATTGAMRMAGQADRGPVAPEEERQVWRSASLDHVTYWLRGWPHPSSRPTLLDELAAVPAGFTCVAVRLVAEPGALSEPDPGVPGRRREPAADDRFDVRALIRVAAPTQLLAQVCEATAETAQAAGADLFRLDGEQAPAVYATTPSGGGPR